MQKQWMPRVSNSTHYFRPYAQAMLARSNPDMSRERDVEMRQREGDMRLQKALAEAFIRGDHLPKPKPVTRPVPPKRHPLFTVWEDDQ